MHYLDYKCKILPVNWFTLGINSQRNRIIKEKKWYLNACSVHYGVVYITMPRKSTFTIQCIHIIIITIIMVILKKCYHNERFWSFGIACLYHMKKCFWFDSILLKTEAVLPTSMPVYMYIRFDLFSRSNKIKHSFFFIWTDFLSDRFSWEL